jgi:ferredoxin-NADP reductase/uncharacterized protein YcbX
MTEARIASIVRFPVKGLPGVSVSGDVALEPGRGLRWDRSHAIENGRAVIASPTAWNERKGYFHVARHEEIVRFGVDLDRAETEQPTLILTAPDGRSARTPLGGGDPGETITGEGSTLDDLLRSTLPSGPFGSPRLVRTGVTGLWDWPDAHLSFINLATVRALADAAGSPVDPRRFRGNVLLEGLPAWGELGLLGRRVRIGTAELEFFQPTDRCRATTIDPTTGVSDLNVPGLLASRFGHMYCGVYARVVSAGSVRAEDTLTVLGAVGASGSTTRSERPAPFAGEPEWPRTGRVVEREPAGSRSVSIWVEDPTGLVGEARPGQHLRVHLPGAEAPGWRAYTVSATAPGRARITVRRDGRISSALHDGFPVGTDIVLTGPFGAQTLDGDGDGDRSVERDVVLVSAGSGITPTAAMLRALVASGSTRRVRVLHTERSAADLALWDEVTDSIARLPDAVARLHLTGTAQASDAASESGPVTVEARAGRPTAEDLRAIVADLDPEGVNVFLCGPALFTADARTTLSGAGIPAAAVHSEIFYSPTTAELVAARAPSTDGPHRLTAGSMEASWRAESGSILDAVEAAGQDWPSGCRVGACGTCVRRLVSGSVEYLVDPIVPPPAGSVLVCCSAPTSDVELDEP